MASQAILDPAAASSTAAIGQARENQRFRELDSVRGIAALAVVFHHFVYLWFFPITQRTGLAALLWYPLISGHEAVILFFVLSGFVLSLSYLRGAGPSYGVFLLRRTLRLYCPYLCALALAVGANAIWHGSLGMGPWSDATWSSPPSARAIWQATAMLGDYDWARFNTAFWSLVVEMRISILFPFLFFFSRRCGVRLTALAAALCPILVQVIHPGLRSDGSGSRTCLFTLVYLPAFFAGILMAQHLGRLRAGFVRLGRAGRVLFFVSCLLLYELSHRIPASIHGLWKLYAWHFEDWPLMAASLGVMLVALGSARARRLLNSAIPAFLGRISYSLYLVHGTVLFTLSYLLRGHPWLLVLAAYLPLAIGLSTVFQRLIEAPCSRLARQLGRSRNLTPVRAPEEPCQVAA